MAGPLIHRMITLAFLGLAMGALHSAFRPLQLAPADPAAVAPTGDGGHSSARTSPTPGTEAPGLNISIEQAAAMYGRGVPFVDARHVEEYEAGHVTNAFWMPSEEFLNGKIPDTLNYLDRESPVVVYCGGGMCDASKNLVVLLQQLGFKRCHIMHDGYPEWAKAGHPTATGKPEVGAP